ncbi:metallophosphoesterase family protein, partial [Aureispira]|nr:metallophosphoesterase family protein [Aureispira sp.]
MKSYLVIFCLFLVFVVDSLALTGRYRCMIRNEPATTLTIGWDQISGTNPMVYYSTNDYGQDFSKHNYHAYPKRTVHAKGMNNHFARLTKLRPNTVYYFVIKDSDATSRCFSFKTLPDEHQSRLSVIGGGDSRNHKIARQNANKIVARCRPHFVLFAGDMTGGDSNREWQEWLNDWQLTIGADGRMTPILTARGNHERSDASIVDIFDVPHPVVYYGLTFARGLLRVYTLNSMQSSNSSQLSWLGNDLKNNQHVAWRMAQYHHPMRPHTRRKYEQEYMRVNWGPLFYKYRMQLALECDSHMSKITWPIRSSNDKTKAGYDEGFVQDPEGTVFVGEGGWGAPLRVADDSKRWTRAMGSFNQVKWFFVDLNKIEIRTIKTENASQVGFLSDNSRFNMPANVDLWEIDAAKHITIFNKKTNEFVPEKPQVLMDITSVSAQFLNDNVYLQWKSIFEISRVKFKIQVSTNKIFWKTIDIISGQGPSASKQQVYKYIDKSEKRGGKYYYRIAAIDKSGKEYVQEFVEIRTLGSQEMETISGSIHSEILQIPIDIPEPTKIVLEL